MKKSSLEFKVGVFVFLALGVLVMLVFKSGDFYLKPGYTVRFIFDFVSGIDPGSPVRLAGVNVGEVKGIHVVRNAEGQTQVELTAWIAQGAFIEKDAEVRINSLGLLGEKYVEVLPGTSGSPTLSEGGTLVGRNPVVMEKITESGNRLINRIEGAIQHINDVVADPAFKASVKGTFGHASSAFGNMERTTENVDRLAKNFMEASEDLKDTAKSAQIVMARLKNGEGTIGRLLTNDSIARDFEELAKDLRAHPWKIFKKG